jgi:Fe-S-cluster containining protein
MMDRASYLKRALDEATRIDEHRLADKIKLTGFKCERCARCCKAKYGDNTVIVFPFEIRRICEKKGIKQKDIVIPAPSQDKDAEGNIHTFEWVLRKERNCIFLKRGLCEIYECRPHICQTYPFYLADGQMEVSECEGIGGEIGDEESRKLAALLKDRYVTELKESIALFERFRGFRAGGRGICIHDSEGEHWLKE